MYVFNMYVCIAREISLSGKYVPPFYLLILFFIDCSKVGDLIAVGEGNLLRGLGKSQCFHRNSATDEH